VNDTWLVVLFYAFVVVLMIARFTLPHWFDWVRFSKKQLATSLCPRCHARIGREIADRVIEEASTRIDHPNEIFLHCPSCRSRLMFFEPDRTLHAVKQRGNEGRDADPRSARG
jgi:uncharacterized protein with PIN domain